MLSLVPQGLVDIGRRHEHYILLMVGSVDDDQCQPTVERIVPRPPVPALQPQLLMRLYIGLGL